MTAAISALKLLADQHGDLLDLFDEIADTVDIDDKRELFNMLADKMAAHAIMEERLFYPVVKTVASERILLESTEEHLAAKRVLADLLTLDVDHPRFDAKLTVLKELVRHHARDDEEAKLFPLVREVFGEAELVALGLDLVAMFDELVSTKPRLHIAAETSEAARL